MKAEFSQGHVVFSHFADQGEILSCIKHALDAGFPTASTRFTDDRIHVLVEIPDGWATNVAPAMVELVAWSQGKQSEDLLERWRKKVSEIGTA